MNRSSATMLTALASACLLAACATAPAPRSAQPPAPPMPTSFNQTLSGDALFAFGKSSFEDLSESGRAELEALAARILAAPAIDVIHVIGHSDRIGSDRGNLLLSNRRAATVRDYLIQSGVPADKITAVGRGSVEPVVSCEGESGRALIDCLAPNRRVEVRVLMP